MPPGMPPGTPARAIPPVSRVATKIIRNAVARQIFDLSLRSSIILFLLPDAQLCAPTVNSEQAKLTLVHHTSEPHSIADAPLRPGPVYYRYPGRRRISPSDVPIQCQGEPL